MILGRYWILRGGRDKFKKQQIKQEIERNQEKADMKLKFFTHVGHELRTSLTLIISPLETLMKEYQSDAVLMDKLNIVQRNAVRLLNLVNQLLDFRKIDVNGYYLSLSDDDIISYIHTICDSFISLSEQKDVSLTFYSAVSSLNMLFDGDKMRDVMMSLLSNAFKYTPQGKMITLFIHENEHNVAVGVQDQGIGISESKKASLFVRFENLLDKNLFNQQSSGIGLSLVKELVELHKATIRVDSKEGEGSCFTVEFFKGKEHYTENVEFILSDSVEMRPEEVEESVQGHEEKRNESKTMLLVEDNLELRFFLRSIFISNFNVIEAVNGAEGLDKALKFVPDIIISDIMMPEKDGITMTEDLRANMATSHIPVVLLTAKTDMDSKLEGMELGVEDYITKPFSATYLKARVENILTQRVKLQQLYCANLMNIQPVPEEEQQTQPEMSSHDRKFMEKLTELMEKNMDNGDLIVDDLVQELAVSRSVFFKKLKTLTGLAPIEFIKEMRVKRAAQLIESGDYNMTQIAYMVGINDPRYFSKCFKQRFGMTPTEYKENAKNKR